VQGTVRGLRGSPASNVVVEIAELVAVTDTSGHYSITGLHVGRHRVKAGDRCDGAVYYGVVDVTGPLTQRDIRLAPSDQWLVIGDGTCP